jgi:RNA polymerase sigma-70 factor (ECF subfamily)
MPRTPFRRTPPAASPGPQAGTAVLTPDSGLAAGIKALVVAGDREKARELFGELVAHQQRRAVRIAYHYLRDAHDADEAVQDAFLKVFTHIATYREDYPFEVWFTRILVNGCLDMRKARARRLRWAVPVPMMPGAPPLEAVAAGPSIEQRLVSAERAAKIWEAVEKLPERQRAVFTLCHLGEQTTADVSQALGLSEATVRVHLFRAVRKLRRLLEKDR